jgi:hypothetical protein
MFKTILNPWMLIIKFYLQKIMIRQKNEEGEKKKKKEKK